MDLELEKLDKALNNWIDLSIHIDRLHQRCVDLFIDGNRFVLTDEDSNSEGLKYLKKVGEYVLECAEVDEDKFWVSEAQSTLKAIDKMIEYKDALKLEMAKPLHEEITDWNAVVELVDRMKTASYKIKRLASIGFILYHKMGGEL